MDIELEDGPLTVGGGIVTATVPLQEGIETILCWVLVTAHEDHCRRSRRGVGQEKRMQEEEGYRRKEKRK